MHQAALLGESLKDAQHYGWAVPDNVNHDWYVGNVCARVCARARVPYRLSN